MKIFLFVIIFLLITSIILTDCQSKKIHFEAVIYGISKEGLFVSVFDREEIKNAKIVIPDELKLEFKPKITQVLEITAPSKIKERELTVITATEVKLKDCNKSMVQKISPEKVKEMMDSEEEFILIDLRTPKEFKESHIKNTLLLPYYEIERLAPKFLKDKKEKIVLYCRSDHRSVFAAEKLVKMGYIDVSYMGCIQSWKYDVIKEIDEKN